MSRINSHQTQAKLDRIAVINYDKCKPKRCNQECKRLCPVVRSGKLCVEVTPNDKKATISEQLCIGCGICVKKCPFGAIEIINLPSNLNQDTIHRYGPNSFKLHRLPTPKPGQVLGLVGTNGIGKSTALKILQGDTKPNLGRWREETTWAEILDHFKGSELQNYFNNLVQGNNFKAIIKDQHPETKIKDGNVEVRLRTYDQTGKLEYYCDLLDLTPAIRSRSIKELSGGELQRLAIALVCIQKADVYIFDEPSSFLDVKQRLKAAQAIRSLVNDSNYVIVVEHDLAVLDYLSDFTCCLYGKPSIYGVVTMPFSVREGINIFLDGYVPTENLRFRDTGLVFKVAESAQEEVKRLCNYNYPNMQKTQGDFHLDIEPGTFTDSEIIVLLGENGTGKTTFIKLMAGGLMIGAGDTKPPEFKISYKPQTINAKSEKTVKELLMEKIPDMYRYPQFQTDVLKPLEIESIQDNYVKRLSGGERQRVALALCLGKPADVYLIDEPSAYLDSEQRLIAAKVIKRFILHTKKTGFIVEHDFIMATYLADRVIVFEGEPGVKSKANSPQSLLTGMNKFLEMLNITFRRDPNNLRPRINKLNSIKDAEQKSSGNYFFLED